MQNKKERSDSNKTKAEEEVINEGEVMEQNLKCKKSDILQVSSMA